MSVFDELEKLARDYRSRGKMEPPRGEEDTVLRVQNKPIIMLKGWAPQINKAVIIYASVGPNDARDVRGYITL